MVQIDSVINDVLQEAGYKFQGNDLINGESVDYWKRNGKTFIISIQEVE